MGTVLSCVFRFQKVHSRTHKISKGTSKNDDPFNDPTPDIGKDGNHKCKNQHPNSFATGGLPQSQGYQCDRPKKEGEDSEHNTRYTVQEDSNPLNKENTKQKRQQHYLR